VKTVDFQGLKVKLDRPKGFVQEGKDSSGKPWRRVYKLDYGYIPKTEGGDGEDVDVFLGPDSTAKETFWVLQHKDDGSFDEYKVFLGFKKKTDAKKAYGDHIPMSHFGGIVAMPIAMMKALLGKEPFEKLARYISFYDELEQIGAALCV
jgi:inorganic pyrophosphatase-like protein